jgi:hypothetical protein
LPLSLVRKMSSYDI